MNPYLMILAVSLFLIGAIVASIFVGRKLVPGGKSSSQEKDSHSSISSEIILNSIDDAVIFVDPHNIIRLFNPGASRITGWEPDEATDIDYKATIKLQDEKGEAYQDENSPFYQALLTREATRDTNANLATKSGSVISVDIGVTPLFDEEDDLEGYIGIFRDVTTKRREEKERADFISTASHEMRTPVAAIEGYLALALNEKVATIDDKAREYLNRAHENSQHLGKLFQDLLSSSKAEDGRLENSPSVVDMGELITNLVQDLRQITESKNIAIDFIIGNDSKGIREGKSISIIKPLYYAHVDPGRIKEVMTNLIDNAIKYSDNSKITVGLTGDQSIIQVRVQDNGIGIPPESKNHIFQKFYRIDNTATRTVGGTGLGLFICKKIIELYNGRIWVESEPGAGSTFFFNIPRISTAKAAELQQTQTGNSTDIRPTIKIQPT